MDWMDVVRYLIVPAGSAVVVWELWTGKALSRNWNVLAVRSERPGAYWANVLVQIAALVLLLVITNSPAG